MDPTATLANIREMITQTLDDEQPVSVSELAESIESLDRWITDGGFLPKDWQEV